MRRFWIWIAVPLIFAGVVRSACAQRQDPVDAVLSFMAGDSGLKNSGSGVSDNIDFDGLLAGMGAGSDDNAGRQLATVGSTLDFMVNMYSDSGSNLTYDYSSYNNFSSPQKMRFLGLGMLPVPGRVTSHFGYRPSFKRMHKGIDVSLHVGDTVRAALDGTVTRVANDPPGYGLYVIVTHSNGLETRYGHLSRQLVTQGMRVFAGDALGLGGSTGNSTGPHLHFETRRNGEAFDPIEMFDFSMPGGMVRNRTLAELENGYRTSPDKSAADGDYSLTGKSTYIVRVGDTLASVCRHTGISLLTLCRLNMLSSTDALQPGRMLKLR